MTSVARSQGRFASVVTDVESLPRGWAVTTLGEILPLTYGKALPKNSRKSSGPYPVFGSSGIVGAHSQAIVPENSIIVGRKGSAGSIYYSAKPSWAIDTAYFTTPQKGLEPRYWFHQLKLLNLASLDQSTAIPSLSRDNYNRLTVLVPPQRQQAQIASKIDELLSRIDVGEGTLKRAKALISRYRQSLLKAAAIGEMTRNWREMNKAKIESPAKLIQRLFKDGQALGAAEFDFLQNVSPDWATTRVDAVGEVQLGRQRAPKFHAGTHMRPYLRVANVFEARFDLSDVMSMNFTPSEFEQYALRSGDIFLNEGQSKELVGRPALYRNELPGGCFTNTLVRFRARKCVIPEFALIVFRYYLHAGFFSKIARITTNIAHLGGGRFSSMSFPLPSLEEQKEIIDTFNTFWSEIDAASAWIEGSLKTSRATRQSVLKFAFEGRLVRQDPADEAAKILLARIREGSVTSRRAPGKTGFKRGVKRRKAIDAD